MEKILTVIIPTYNMEKYLDKCLTSLIIDDKELLKSLEVLVVIDGAKDRSSEIAHKYQDRFSEIFRVIDKENGNYGSCINRGLKEATGKYIKVLDADDYFDTLAFGRYLRSIVDVDADLILNDCQKVDERGCFIGNFSIKSAPMNTVFEFGLISADAVFIQMHCVAYRTNLLRSINYVQDEGISYTDQEWVCYPMSAVKDAFYVKEKLYMYLLGREGQTMDPTILTKKFCDEVVIVKRMLSWLNESTDDALDKAYIKNKIMHHLVYLHINHIIYNVYSKEEFWQLSQFLMSNYKEIYILLENIDMSKTIPLKFILNYHRCGLDKLPYSVKIRIGLYKSIQKLKSYF